MKRGLCFHNSGSMRRQACIMRIIAKAGSLMHRSQSEEESEKIRERERFMCNVSPVTSIAR